KHNGKTTVVNKEISGVRRAAQNIETHVPLSVQKKGIFCRVFGIFCKNPGEVEDTKPGTPGGGS
ncbi:hypothetical protein KJ758_00920, partial [Patescibacteria group bacterium]|nr:hypothetical protein [Patescibacteria group bacterium]